ncbi:MAG TPA: hypothetical protein VGF09_07920 [Solirubrobacterales bacterium]
MIAAAVVFFILFVSAQALRDWPISDLNFGGGNDSTAVSPAQSLGAGSASPAAANLNGPVTATPANVGPAAKAGGGNGNHKAAGHHNTSGKVAPETQIQGSRGVDSAPVQQPSSTSPAPAPTSGSSPPAGSGTASPSPSGGGSSPATGNSGSSPATGNVGTTTARRVTHTVNQIASAATPPSPSPVTNAVGAVEEKVAPTPPPSGSTVEKVKGAIEGIGN